MKTLELELNKRLLIVELPEHSDMNDPFQILPNSGFNYLVFSQNNGHVISRYKLPDGDWKIRYNGCDLTEDIANTFVERVTTTKYKNYRNVPNYFEYLKNTALESFISAIESKGYHWGENPIKHPESMDIIPSSLGWWLKQVKNREDAESRTFYPEKCIICEIL